jgi:16S rRNA (adenine1518-N6/adenine1519-N6)-dimethyltransferase
MSLEKIKPLKIFGQNFLQDKNIANKIVDLLGDISGKQIVEIGAGMGALTELLLNRNANLTAFDFDERAIDYLKSKFNFAENLKIIHSDILKINLNDYTNEKISVIGNIPYNITNDIVFWLFDNSNLINRAILTIQKEVAERYIAKPRTKNYGITTIAMQLYATVKIAFHIPASAFYPAPKVTSSVLVIDFHKENQFENIDKKQFLKLVRAAFSQRRKILNNAINFYLISRNINSELFTKIIQNQPKNYLKMRAEELTLDDYINLFSLIEKNLN